MIKTDEKVAEAKRMLDNGSNISSIAYELDVSRNTVYRWLFPDYHARRLAKDREYDRTHPRTEEEKKARPARERAIYVSTPYFRAKFRRLVSKYGPGSQPILEAKVRLIVLGHAGRTSPFCAPFAAVAIGKTSNEFSEKFNSGQIDFLVPLNRFDLTNPEHLVRALYYQNITNDGKGYPGDPMTLPWSENPDALVQAYTFLSRQLAMIKVHQREEPQNGQPQSLAQEPEESQVLDLQDQPESLTERQP